MIRLLVPAAAVGLIIGACGGGGEDLREQIRTVDPSIDDDTVDCIIDELEARGLSAGDISDAADRGAPIPEGGQEAFSVCVVPPSGDDPDSPGAEEDVDAYGSDPTLDGLWDACDAGDGAACDDLYFRSPIGSEYEAFGDTCGGRFDSSTELCGDRLAEPSSSEPAT